LKRVKTKTKKTLHKIIRNSNMSFILTSRFDDSTWRENCDFRKKYPDIACIYGSPQQITEKIPLNSLIFIIEMNNSTNKIEGIGLIRNILHRDKKQRVYQTGNYNRYIYHGNYRIDRSILEKAVPQIIMILEIMLFTGKTHLKRGRGFTRISEKLYNIHKILEKYNYTDWQIKEEIVALFKRQFTESIDQITI